MKMNLIIFGLMLFAISISYVKTKNELTEDVFVRYADFWEENCEKMCIKNESFQYCNFVAVNKSALNNETNYRSNYIFNTTIKGFYRVETDTIFINKQKNDTLHTFMHERCHRYNHINNIPDVLNEPLCYFQSQSWMPVVNGNISRC